MGPPVCITGVRFSLENEAVLWTHAMARGHTSDVWLPRLVVERLRLPKSAGAVPVGINAANGRRFFYNLSQLRCSEKELRSRVCGLAGDDKKTCEPDTLPPRPLNTNGEPLPQTFAREVIERFGAHEDVSAAARSRYWATEDEAEYIFDSPFDPAFLRKENGVALRVDAGSPPIMYYNVCGTRRPDVFNINTCCRYQPVNFYGHRYAPAIAVHMKASAIAHGCVSSHIWLTTRRAAMKGIRIRSGVKPLTLCYNGIFHLVNTAMTDDPARVLNLTLSQTASDQTDDASLTVP